MSDSAKTGSQNSLLNCKFSYDGKPDRAVLEEFLSAVDAFITTEKIDVINAYNGIPLLLRGEAATWWIGAKNIESWDSFKEQLRNTFAPKPAHVLYQEIMQAQPNGMKTAQFIIKKRFLFSLLPPPQHPEKQQIDMIYGLLHENIRSRVVRDSINTFEELITKGCDIESLMNKSKAQVY